MASPQRKLEHFPIRRDVERTDARARSGVLGKKSFASTPTRTQFHFSDPREEHRRAVKVVAIAAAAAVVSLGALIYFAGAIAGAIAVGVVALLIKFGYSVLDDTIELH